MRKSVTAAMLAACLATTGAAIAQKKSEKVDGKLKLPDLKYETYTLRRCAI